MTIPIEFQTDEARHEPEPLRVLIVEDSMDDTRLIERELRRGGFDVHFERVETRPAMEKALRTVAWDLVISDYSLPQFSGQTALEVYSAQGTDAPFIMVSGVMGEERAVEMVKAGAHDYVMKDHLRRLVPAVRRELQAAQQRRTRKRLEHAAAFLASLVESCNDAIIGEDLQGKIRSWNSGAERLYGYTAQEVLGCTASILVPVRPPDEAAEYRPGFDRTQPLETYETVGVRKDGSQVELSLAVCPIRDSSGKVIGKSAVARDISGRKQEETEHLRLIQDLTEALAQGPKHPIEERSKLTPPNRFR